MVDLMVDKFCGKFIIYKIQNGKKIETEEIRGYDYNDVIDYINENYDYARILCGKCIY